MRKIKALTLLVILLVSAGGTLAAKPSVQGPSLAVGSQYDGAHVYLAPEDLRTQGRDNSLR
jgi:hypothetical protein